MIVVIDTNVIISALIKDSITRKIIVESNLHFKYPQISLQELLKYKGYILDKTGYSKENLEIIMNKLLEHIDLVPLEIIQPWLNASKEIMEQIDINDAVFIATSLALDNSVIWSDDADFERQKVIKILKTKDLVKMFKK